MRYRHVILDRDGVLNREAAAAGYIRDAAAFEWLAGAREGLAALRRARVRISIATNQSGVGRGLMTAGELEAVHARMLAEAAASGGALDAVFVCAHAPEAGCDCRKPAPGLIVAALAAGGVSAAETLVVGDDARDLEAAARAGVAAALVRTGKGRQTEARLSGARVSTYDDLWALAQAITASAPDALETP
ncbi:MAG TPA: HAD-IIIA family hydrolase [Steroidobacteraceae bacterium]|nr:HAD-IIIA family hydrolase [Steroidobacteraceae bacterium]